MIRQIHQPLINEYWPRVLPLLQPAIDGRRVKSAEVRQWLLRGDFQLWVCGSVTEIKAVAVTAITIYPGSKWLTIVHCAGTDMPQWLDDGLDSLERFGIGAGCDGVEIIGREEWGRVLEGFETAGTLIQKRFMPNVSRETLAGAAQ